MRDVDARRHLEELDRQLRQTDERPRLLLTTGVVALPDSVLEALRDAVRALAHGGVVAVATLPPDLTTQQAAWLLQVSRPSLVALLERGEIPSHRRGTQRRVRTSDLLDYRRTLQARHDPQL